MTDIYLRNLKVFQDTWMQDAKLTDDVSFHSISRLNVGMNGCSTSLEEGLVYFLRQQMSWKLEIFLPSNSSIQ